MFEISDVIKKVPFFKPLDRDAVNEIVDLLQYKSFRPGEIVCHAGEIGEEMFIIISGKVKVVVITSDGEENIIAELGSGDYFGEMALLTGEPRSASVVTTEPAELFTLGKADFDDIIERYPSIALSMGRVMSQRLHRLLQKSSNKKARVTAVSGDLQERSLVDLLRFCEINYLNGTLHISNGQRSGHFEYLRGELQKVVLDDLPEDRALDEMLGWEAGTFTIEPAPLKLDNQKKSTDAPQHPDTVVHLNANHIVQRLLTKALSQQHWQVLSAATAAEALELVVQHPGAVVLTAAKLPDTTLESFIKSLRQSNATPVVILTDDDQIPALKERLGPLPGIYFTKSPRLEEVIAALEPLRTTRAV